MGLDELKSKLPAGVEEKVSDTAIQKGGDVAEAKVGHAEQVDKVETIADGKIGE